jgi:hypothetical protein
VEFPLASGRSPWGIGREVAIGRNRCCTAISAAGVFYTRQEAEGCDILARCSSRWNVLAF